jgi:tRNA nucleotidyltransferase (CCA-adding enzyme)
MAIPNSIWKFAQRIDNFFLGSAYLCGGWVRDHILGVENKDYDIEVHGVPVEVLKNFIGSYYDSDIVGESFKVWKVYMLDDDKNRITVDVSIPRLDKKVAEGHKGFEVVGDPFLPVEEACRRRDFTMNSMLYHILDNEIIDPYGGQEDIKNKIIKAVDPETFVEDSLRVLRAMQFAARFNFSIDADTVKLCQGIDLSDLPAERLWVEIEKWLLSKHPGKGLNYFYQLNIASQLCPKSSWGDANAQCVADALDILAASEGSYFTSLTKAEKIVVSLYLLSDLFWSSVELGKFLERLKLFTIDGQDVRKMVLALSSLYNVPVTDSDIRRFSLLVPIYLFCVAQMVSSLSLGRSSYWARELFGKAETLNCAYAPLKPLLMGKHVLELGVPQGKFVGEICKAVFELQLDGKISTVEEAIEEARKYVMLQNQE